ncbi:hypothetical protein WISP_37707 [Willisornis vidua]|uniref:Uncharacterized protein n=1 Tax=Willisornis vidua TaxID=1566151 RepID=A0ABQ9DJA1_9PASS|nr:hypothetical protein WISP_37707 [Willisornis vidua]
MEKDLEGFWNHPLGSIQAGDEQMEKDLEGLMGQLPASIQMGKDLEGLVGQPPGSIQMEKALEGLVRQRLDLAMGSPGLVRSSSTFVNQPPPVVVTFPGPILSSFPQDSVVGSAGAPVVGGSGSPLGYGGYGYGGYGYGGYGSLGYGGLYGYGGSSLGYGGLWGYGGSSLGYGGLWGCGSSRGLYGYGRSFGSCSPYSYRSYRSCGVFPKCVGPSAEFHVGDREEALTLLRPLLNLEINKEGVSGVNKSHKGIEDPKETFPSLGLMAKKLSPSGEQTSFAIKSGQAKEEHQDNSCCNAEDVNGMITGMGMAPPEMKEVPVTKRPHRVSRDLGATNKQRVSKTLRTYVAC